MSTNDFNWSLIIGKEYNSIKHLFNKLIIADCFHFEHYNDLVKTFKNKMKIYCGDFELSVYCLDRIKNPDISFNEFIANCLIKYNK